MCAKAIHTRKLKIRIKRGPYEKPWKTAEMKRIPRGSRQRAAKDMGHKIEWLGMHSVAPKDGKLTKKLGLKKGEKINFFAVYSGEWAKALAQETEVFATDISRSGNKKLKKNKGGIKSVKRQAAQYQSIIPDFFDWSISFEPFPVSSARGLEDVSRNALINRKGMKIIYHRIPKMEEKNHEKRIQAIAKIYGAEFNAERKKITIQISNSIETKELLILTLKTNPEARKKAELDLYVERRKYSRPKTQTQAQLVEQLAKEFNKTQKEIKESLHRIKLTEKTGLICLW